MSNNNSHILKNNFQQGFNIILGRKDSYQLKVELFSRKAISYILHEFGMIMSICSSIPSQYVHEIQMTALPSLLNV